MAMSPREVDRLMLWEFAACVDGFVKAKGGEVATEAPSIEEHLEMLQRLKPRS